MTATEEILAIVKNQKGIKGFIKRSFFKWIFAGFEAIDVDIKTVTLEAQENTRIFENKINALWDELGNVKEENIELHNKTYLFEEKVRKLVTDLEQVREENLKIYSMMELSEDKINNLVNDLKQIQKINEKLFNKIVLSEKNMEDLQKLKEDQSNTSTKVQDLEIYLKTQIEQIQLEQLNTLKSEIEFLKTKIYGMQRKQKDLYLYNAESPNEKIVYEKISNLHASQNEYDMIDYFDFENHFRGSIDEIKNRQAFYLKYFSGKNKVLDIGCGRGEFLSLLQENGINAIGVDIYEAYVDYCVMQGLNVFHIDATEYLLSMDDYVEGIFIGQVVEHLEPTQIMQLCELAYEKLSKGGCLVIETPNPTSLAIYTHAFYIDPSHCKPIHPLTLKYYLEKAGFRNNEIIYTESSKLPCEIPELECGQCENIEQFNQSMQIVSEFMFGSQDYAIIAIKE